VRADLLAFIEKARGKASAVLSGGGQTGYLASLWVQAGGDPAVANIAAAIAMGESGGRNNARLVSNVEDSRGLWQINTRAHPWAKNLNDPLANARAAVRIYKQSGGFGPWSVYTSGKYKQYLKSETQNVSYDPTVPPTVNKAISAAMQQLGQKYVWGAEGRNEGGFDCSGLIDWAFRQAGVDLPGRLTTWSAAKLGRPIAPDVRALKPGDLIISNNGKHMTLYIGNGQVIAASSSRGRVVTQALSSLGRITAARRLDFGGYA
jgi:cell wall-associated NlpC family hydrolase